MSAASRTPRAPAAEEAAICERVNDDDSDHNGRQRSPKTAMMACRLVNLVLVGLLAFWLDAACHRLAVSAAGGEVFTNSFLVRLAGSPTKEIAHQVAKRNGFVNLGPVSTNISPFFSDDNLRWQ